jgi:hypothetical protein
VPAEDAHRDAYWVITVVGGLSIAKAIEDTLGAISVSHWTSENGIVLGRFFIFLLTSVRLFIGASVFFQAVHIQSGHETKFVNRNYVLDFGSAILHFSILYLLALNIKTIQPPPVYLSNELFFLALCGVLLYDWAWYLASTQYSTGPLIRKWALNNTVALFFPCSAIFAIFKYGGIDRNWFEFLTAGWITLASIPDLYRMKKGWLPGEGT